MRNAEVPIERYIKIEPIKFVVEEQGERFKMDGCKVTTKSDTVFFNCEDYEISFFATSEDYKDYSADDILCEMKKDAQKNQYQWYSADKIIKEEKKTTWWKFELENKHNFAIKKKLVEEGHSKVFKEWSKYSTITKEDFIKALEWVCNDPLTADGKVTREIGLTPTNIVKLTRVYNDLGLSSLYKDGEWWNGETFTKPCENEREKLFSYDGRNIEGTYKVSISCRERI